VTNNGCGNLPLRNRFPPGPGNLLRGKKMSSSKGGFICFDTEDNSAELMAAGKSGFDKEVTQIAAKTTGGKRYYSKGDCKGFLKWLRLQPERFIYALNTQYDLGAFFADSLEKLDITLVGNRFIRAKWEGTDKIFADVYNIYQMSVAALGKVFGMDKLAMDIHSKEYVFRDVEIIYKAMEFAWKFAAEQGVEDFCSTIGGLGLKVWKAWGGENCHNSSVLARAAYYGGRVELFKVRNETDRVLYTDINSLYPTCMTLDFPGPLEEWTGSKLPKFGVINCRIKLPKLPFGLLPYRHEDGRILFPWGEFTGSWTVAEINAAIERGGKIVDIFAIEGTNETMIPYRHYMQHAYERRLNSSNGSEKAFFKLLMNTLYGRLGSSGEIGRTVWATEKNQGEGVCFGEKVLINYMMPLQEETNWSHAAYVTSYGRLKLLEYLERIGAERLIYCDTDSTIFDCPGEIPFECGNELGQMKIEQRCSVCGNFFSHKPACPGAKGLDFWDRCETYAPKMYRSGNSYKAKGVPKRLAKQFIETGAAEFELPFKLREAIRFYDRGNSRKLSVWRKVRKELRGSYDKKQLRGNRYFACKIIDDLAN
jgi:hypothetical protein